MQLPPKASIQRYAELGLAEMGEVNPEVSAAPKIDENAEFEIISVTVGSGAYNTAGPQTTGTHFKVTPTEASSKGRHYCAANGSVIRNYGQRIITGRTNEGTLV